MRHHDTNPTAPAEAATNAAGAFASDNATPPMAGPSAAPASWHAWSSDPTRPRVRGAAPPINNDWPAVIAAPEKTPATARSARTAGSEVMKPVTTVQPATPTTAHTTNGRRGSR
jgi:hypothetical protein